MPGNEKRRQKAIERRTAKRKAKVQSLQRSAVAQVSASDTAALRVASQWPLLECWVPTGWDKTTDLPLLLQIVVARQAPSGKVAAALFLVDLACLGVKNADTRVFASRSQYQDDMLAAIAERQPLEKSDLDLAARIIREGVAYAKALGFSPHRDYPLAATLLAGANPDASDVTVPLGYQGKPYFVSGPFDNVRRIIAQLTRAVGEGNFNYTVGVGPDLELDQEVLVDNDELLSGGKDGSHSIFPRGTEDKPLSLWDRLRGKR